MSLRKVLSVIYNRPACKRTGTSSASVRIIGMHFNISHSTIQEISSRELGLRKFFRRWVSHQPSDSQKKFRVDSSVELLALLDQYFELHFEGIAIGDESWVRCASKSGSRFARRREEMSPRLRPQSSTERERSPKMFQWWSQD
jgi:hypothetical protein